MSRSATIIRLLALWLPCVCLPAFAFDVRRLTLEELMELNVYSVSRRDEALRQTAAAVYVLTAEEIRRARVTSVPEALRLVPGVQVARVDANKWAVSIRGFNSRSANKLQVMIDGRSIYDPLFSGVLWESRDVMLENIDRIEVIRGPGGTLWGANAVNGVINIVTKHAYDTQGGLAVVGAGTEERARTALRYGWRTGDRHAARISANVVSRDDGYSADGPEADDSHLGRAALRWDWDPGAGHEMFVSSDWYAVRAGEFRRAGDSGGLPGSVDAKHYGGHLMLTWARRLSAANRWQARAYYERFTLDNPSVLRERRDIYHAEFQHDLTLTERQRLVWGASFRDTQDEITNVRTFGFDPSARRDRVTGAFVQDTIALVPQTLELTFGTKVENNDYTGTEWHPNARMAYFVSPRHTAWGAISRAVRTPSRLEADVVLGGTALGDSFDVERLTAYELGHRFQPDRSWSVDTAAFYNVYDDLRTLETAPLRLANRMHGNTYGVELSTHWQARRRLRFNAGYTYMRMDLKLDPQSTDVNQPDQTEGATPHHALTLRTEWDVRHDLEFDVTLRYVDELPAQQVPAYTTLDLGLGWRIRPGVDLVVVGQNLFDPHHPEQASAISTEVQRGFYTKVNWRF